jgi:hypothetical protein
MSYPTSYNQLSPTETNEPPNSERPLISLLPAESSPASICYFTRIQHMCRKAAYVLSLLSLMVAFYWVRHIGGLAWEYGEALPTFNWHPLLMTVAFVLMTIATLSFRSNTLRSCAKLIHGGSWFLAAVCMGVALRAVFRSHDDATRGYIANFYSFHSWMGALLCLLFILQFTSGLVSFSGLPISISPTTKHMIWHLHRFAGPTVYVLVAVTMMLGIQEKEGFIVCSYEVHEVYFFPRLLSIPLACRISHLLGCLLTVTAICTMLALYEPRMSTHEERRE